jgi:hypothetical protein
MCGGWMGYRPAGGRVATPFPASWRVHARTMDGPFAAKGKVALPSADAAAGALQGRPELRAWIRPTIT